MKKIVINRCYGGFSLSLKAQKRLAELKNKKVYFYKQIKYNYKNKIDEYQIINDLETNNMFVYSLEQYLGDTFNNFPEDVKWFENRNIERDDEDLIKVIEALGKEANGGCASLEIIEIPDNVEWEIEEYDGLEWVSESHKTWS